MKKIILVLTVLGVSLTGLLLITACSSSPYSPDKCIRGKGQVVTQKRHVPQFYSISTKSTISIKVQYADSCSVKVTEYQNLLPHLKTEVKDGTLYVYYDVCVTDAQSDVQITMPKIYSLNLSGVSEIQLKGAFEPVEIFKINTKGVSDVTINGFVSKVVEAQLGGVSNLNAIFTDDLDALNITASGVSDLTVSGKNVAKLYIEASGTTNIDADDITARLGIVRTSGMSVVDVNVTDLLKADASGLSSITYSGNPETIEIHKSSLASISSAQASNCCD